MNQKHGESCIATFANALAASASSVLSQAIRGEWQVTVACAEKQQTTDPVTLLVVATKSLEGEFALRLSRADAAHLAAMFMGSTESEAQWTGETQEALEELFRQLLGELATQLRPRFGPIVFQLSKDVLHSETTPEVLLKACSGPRLISMTLQVNDKLVESLHGVAAASGASPAPVVEDSSPAERNLDLLMDVELGATLRFGRKVMTLRNILELASGSVIELDRQVHEPVDLLLEGKLVARGEVVIVDGNYGLRVTEVAAASQKRQMWQ